MASWGTTTHWTSLNWPFYNLEPHKNIQLIYDVRLGFGKTLAEQIKTLFNPSLYN